MGTANFFKVNARDYYVVDDIYNEQEEYYECLAEVDIEDATNDLCAEYGYYEPNISINKSECHELCRKDIDLPYFGNDENTLDYIHLSVFINYGHYQGANFDYRIFIYDDEMTPDDLKEFCFEEWYAEQSCKDEYINKLTLYKAKCFYNNFVDCLCDEIDKILSKMCYGIYQVSARFSNGETWYSKKA